MLAGYLPFEDPNTSQLYKKILAGDYKCPKYISQDARDLLKNILCTDPTKRSNIQDIRKHSWMNMYNHKVPQGLIVGQNIIPVDYEILKQLSQFGINLDYAEKCIENNRHNHVTTTYYLLFKKFLISGGKSNADINSEYFQPIQLIRKQVTGIENNEKRSTSQHNPLPLIRRNQKLGRVTHSSQANDESPINAKSRSQNYSIQTQQNSIPQSPKLFNHSADVSSRKQQNPLDLQRTTAINIDMNSTSYRLGDSAYPENNKVLKLKTPVARNRVISDYYGKFPKKLIGNNQETRQRSIDHNGDQITHQRTFYRASPLQKRI